MLKCDCTTDFDRKFMSTFRTVQVPYGTVNIQLITSFFFLIERNLLDGPTNWKQESNRNPEQIN